MFGTHLNGCMLLEGTKGSSCWSGEGWRLNDKLQYSTVPFYTAGIQLLVITKRLQQFLVAIKNGLIYCYRLWTMIKAKFNLYLEFKVNSLFWSLEGHWH